MRFKKLPGVMYTTAWGLPLRGSPKAFKRLPLSLPYEDPESGNRERYPVRKVAEDLARENEVLFMRVPPRGISSWGVPYCGKDPILHLVIIYANGIFAGFDRTDSNGVMIPGRWSRKTMRIEFVPSEDINKIHRFKFTFLGRLQEPFLRLSLDKFPTGFRIRTKYSRLPTGFHIQTKDGRICILGISELAIEYNDMVLALKKCLGKRWSDVYRERILYDREVTRLQ